MARTVEPPQGKHKEFALRFRQAVNWAGMGDTYAEIAIKLGMSKVFFGELNRGEKLPSVDKATELAMKLGVSFEWLMTGRGSMVLGRSSQIIDISHLTDSDQSSVLSIIKSLESK